MTAAVEIKAELARRSMTVKDLSELMGCHYETLRRRLKGEAPITDVDITAIGEALHVPGWEFMRRANENKKNGAPK